MAQLRASHAKLPSVGRSSGSTAPTAQQILDKLASVLDVQFTLSQDGTKIENLVFQLTGLGAQLIEVPTSFTWGGWSYGSSLGGRGISPGYAWIGGVHTKVWCANDGVANLYWTADDWVTVVQDTSLFGIVGPGFLNWHPPCLRYLTINGVPSWVATSDQSGAWYYAQDIAANFNANGTLKASAWVLGTAAPHVIADIGVSSSASCMVGNHGFITRTVNWTSFTDVYSGANVIGGIDTDRSGKWVAFERDTGVLLMSTNDGVTWTAPQAYVRSNEGDPYVAASSVIPTGSVCAGNGIWLITGASGYAYSYDGIHWTIQNNPLGSFYGVGFDGVKFYAVNPNNAGSPPPVIYQLLVSEIPAHHQLVAEKGMSVDLGLWLPFLASAGILGTNDTGAVIERQGVALDWFGLDTTPETTIPTDVGTFSWNATDKTVDLVQPDGVTLQIGQETQLLALNNTGSNLVNGQLVYVSGASGNRVTIALADADGVGTDGVIGMLTQDIANNQTGKVTLLGLVRDIDTSAFAEGAPVYLSSTPGAKSTTMPGYPASVYLVGYVARSHAVNGSILVYVRKIDRDATTYDAVVQTEAEMVAALQSNTVQSIYVRIPSGGQFNLGATVSSITVGSVAKRIYGEVMSIGGAGGLTLNTNGQTIRFRNQRLDVTANVTLPGGGTVNVLQVNINAGTMDGVSGTRLYEFSNTPASMLNFAQRFWSASTMTGTPAGNNQVLRYNSASGLWVPSSIDITAPYGQELFSYSVSETEGAIGQNGALNGTSSAGTRAFAFIPSGNVDISKMRVQITQTTASNMRLGIYDDSGKRVAQSGRFSPVSGINTVSLTSTVSLTGGALYYMAYWSDDTTANVRFKLLSGRSTGTSQPLDQRHDANEMPTTIASGMTNTAYRAWLMISG